MIGLLEMREIKDRKYSIFLASNLSLVTPELFRFYRGMREVCDICGKSSFLPLDFASPSKFDTGILNPKFYNLVSDKIAQAEMGVFYLGLNSTDVGIMLAKAKRRDLPIIFMYESEKEAWLKANEPKVWWRLKTEEELSSSKPSGLITSTSHNSFLMPNSTYPKIVAEIKFKTKEKSLSELEEKIKKFFYLS